MDNPPKLVSVVGKTKHEPPRNLSAEAKELWTKLQVEYRIEDGGGLLLLQTAMEAFCRMKEAQAMLKKEGIAIVDKYGQRKMHPAAMVERDNRMAMMAALKALNLDVEPIKDRAGRPFGS